MSKLQTTVAGTIRLSGVSYHSGLSSTVTLMPSGADTGIVFAPDSNDGEREFVPVSLASMRRSSSSMVLGSATGHRIRSVEYLLATLYMLEIDNCLVIVDGPELPALGSRLPECIDAIERCGIVNLSKPRRYIKLIKPVHAIGKSSLVELRPHDSLVIRLRSQANTGARQDQFYSASPQDLRELLIKYRMVHRKEELEVLWKAGMALGATWHHAGPAGKKCDQPIKPGDHGSQPELYRLIQTVADLTGAGGRILGSYMGLNAGHALNRRLLAALHEDRESWSWC